MSACKLERRCSERIGLNQGYPGLVVRGVAKETLAPAEVTSDFYSVFSNI